MTSSTTSANDVDPLDCKHCGHPIGYHWYEQEKCSCKDCSCPGFEKRGNTAKLESREAVSQ